MVEWRGLSSKIESFAMEHPVDIFCLIARVVRSMRGYLEMRSFAVGAL